MSGMGDQIKRYCEKLEPEEYEELLDNEVRSSYRVSQNEMYLIFLLFSIV